MIFNLGYGKKETLFHKMSCTNPSSLHTHNHFPFPPNTEPDLVSYFAK